MIKSITQLQQSQGLTKKYRKHIIRCIQSLVLSCGVLKNKNNKKSSQQYFWSAQCTVKFKWVVFHYLVNKIRTSLILREEMLNAWERNQADKQNISLKKQKKPCCVPSPVGYCR